MRVSRLARALCPPSLLAALILISCGGVGGAPLSGEAPTTGGLEVRLRDCPIEGVENVFVTIESVEILRVIDGKEVRETVTSVPGQYDLLELQDGVEAVLGDGEFPPGDYRWIRLHVAQDSKKDRRNKPADELKNYIVIEGEPHPLVVPHGHKKGIRLGKDFTIEAGVTTVLTLDFDVNESVRRLGRRGEYRLKPKIRVIVTTPDGDEGAGIFGMIGTTDGTGLPASTVVSVQQGGSVVATGMPDALGAYAVTGLADGSYDVVVIAPGYNFASAAGVTVSGGSADPLDFSVSPADIGAIFGVVSPPGADVDVGLLWSGYVVGMVGADPATGDYLFDMVPAGDYTVEATDGTSTASGSATVTGGNATQLDLAL